MSDNVKKTRERSKLQRLVDAGSRGQNRATVMGAVPLAGPALAALSANKNRGVDTAVGSLAGQLAGGYVGRHLLGRGLLGAVIGGAAGARLGHGSSEKRSFIEGFIKQARELTTKARNKLPDSAFVFSKERKFPIHDEAHARNALARAHFASDPDRVRRAVKAKYPHIGQEKAAGFGIPFNVKIDPKSLNDALGQLKSTVQGNPVKLTIDEEQIKRILGQVEAAGERLKSVEAKKYFKPALVIGGGVAAGQALGQMISNKLKKELRDITKTESKTAEASKEELKRLLRTHEERETPDQEAAESREEQRLERKAGVEKYAFLGLFHNKKKGHEQAKAVFEGQVQSCNELHPLPTKTVEQWRAGLDPDKHTHAYQGHNHFADQFNPWLHTSEGKKWNEAQARKYRRRESAT